MPCSLLRRLIKLMKKTKLLVLVFIAFSTSVFAQDKLLTLDDIFSPDAAKRVRFSGTPVAPVWAPDGKSFKQTINGRLMRVDAASGNAVPYYDSGSLAAALMRVGIRADEANAMANSQALQFNAGETGILLNAAGDLWFYDVASKNLRRLTNNKDEEKEAEFSPDGRLASFVRRNDLFVVDIANAREKHLTRDGREGDKAIYNGYLDWIYEEELYGRGTRRGYWWSPDSRYIAFLRLDEERVPLDAMGRRLAVEIEKGLGLLRGDIAVLVPGSPKREHVIGIERLLRLQGLEIELPHAHDVPANFPSPRRLGPDAE